MTLGAVVAVLAVALTTLVLYPLKEVAPVLALGVVYLLAVLAVASFWGVTLGLLTAFASAAAFNFFHIPPTGQFTIADEENWVALCVFFVAAIFVAELAERARRRAAEAEERRREADLGAELVRLLLRGEDLSSALSVASHRLAGMLGLESAEIARGAVEAGEGKIAFPLRDGPSQLGTLLVPETASEGELARIQERVVPGSKPSWERHSSVTACSASGSKPWRSAGPTGSRPRSCVRSRTTSARRSPQSAPRLSRWRGPRQVPRRAPSSPAW